MQENILLFFSVLQHPAHGLFVTQGLWNQGSASGQANFPGKLCQLRCELRLTHFARAARGHRDSGSQGDEDQAEVAATAQKRAGQEEGKAGG